MSESLADVVHEAVERAKADESFDPAAIMAEHTGDHECAGDWWAPEVPWWSPDGCQTYRLAEALAASVARPVVVRSVTRGSRRYWLIDGLEAHAVWVTHQLPDPDEWVQPNALGHASRSCVDGDVPGEDCDCR